MEENKKRRIRLVDNSDMVWAQRRAREEKTVHSNTVKDETLLHRNAKKAKEAEDKVYGEKLGRTDSDAVKRRRVTNRQIREGLDVRNHILRQERVLDIEGAFSFEDLRRAQNSPTLVGKRKPIKIRKKDVKGLEGRTSRKKRSRAKLLPSERRSRLNRAKIERNRKKYRDRMVKKELMITDANGKKISIERLRKLRGLSKNEAIKKNDIDFAKKYTLAQEKAKKSKSNSARLIRKRDENTR